MVRLLKDWDGTDFVPGRKTWAAATMPILVAEPALADARNLMQGLARLGRPVRVAMSASEVMDLLRREVFDRAVVAAELTLDGEPIVARLGRLPMLKHVVAIGTAGDVDLERRTRIAGAHVYLTRPVSAEDLAGALGLAGVVGSRA